MSEEYNPLIKGNGENLKSSRSLEDELAGSIEPSGFERLKGELPEKLETKGEIALRQFLELSRLYEILNSWQSSDFEQIEINEQTGRKMNKKEKEDLAREISEAKEKLSEIMDKLEDALRDLLESPALQNVFKSRLGREVGSLEEAKGLARRLLKPFYETYKDNLSKVSGNVQTRLDAKDIAWAMTGISTMELPQEEGLDEKEKSKNRNKRKKDWDGLLRQLQVLYGPHQTSAQDFFDLSKSKEEAALGIIESFKEFETPDEELTEEERKERAETRVRFGKLEIYDRENLERLQEDLKQAELVLAQIIRGPVGELRKKIKETEPTETEGLVGKKPPKPPRERETKEKQTGLTSFKEAKEIMGSDFIGPEEIRQSLGIELKETPPIPFTREELEKFKAEGFQLILRVDKDAQGQPLTMSRLHGFYTPKLAGQNKGKVLYKVDWYPNEAFFIAETPRLGWVLQQKDFLSDSAGKNYLEQTQLILDYLTTKNFFDPLKEKQRQEAVREAERLLPEIAELDISQDWQEVAQRLAALKINNYRRSPAEVVYDHALSLDAVNSRLFNGRALYDWTRARSSSGYLVGVGRGDADGLRVHSWGPEDRDGSVGVSLSV